VREYRLHGAAAELLYASVLDPGIFDWLIPELTSTPPSLGEAVQWSVRLGGFLARNNSGKSVPHVLWREFQHRPYITNMFFVMRQNK
jgi:hypothetical protein